MADLVGVQNYNKKNPFADFSLNPSTQSSLLKNLQPAAPDSFEAKQTEEKQTKKLGKTIAFSALGAGAAILFLMRGLPKNAYKTIEKWTEKLENKLNKQRQNGQVGKFEEFYTFTLNKLNKFLEKAKSINNFVSIKDISFEKLMSKTKVTKKIHSKITEVYEKIGRHTVQKSYDKAKTRINGLFQTFEDYDEKILSNVKNKNDLVEGKTVENWLDDVEDYKTLIRRTWNANCGQRARDARFKTMKDDVATLSDDVWEATVGNLKNLKQKKMYETFIAEEMLAGKKLRLINETRQARFIITRDIDDIYNSSLDIIRHITTFIKTKDSASRQIIKDLRLKLESWKKLSGPSEKANRLKLNAEINEMLNKLSQSIKENKNLHGYNTETVNQLVSNIQDINKIMGENGKGALQEMLTIYKKILPREDYLKLKQHVNKTVKDIDNAITKETDNFFDMNRDLKLGSAPTDILSILAAIGAVGAGLSKSENKDQQQSVLLRAGIPAIGAIATSLYFSASLVSGGRSMLYGAISGLAISKAGSMLDEYRKKHFPVKEQSAKSPQ
ncbi:hypothetical protein DBY21_03220 [Candidatus Gastranaerophilales bacterium]|nr:MAG: hypothetical protein DBY21_03220 [Candidatus Gastranaerophilales bacterium]